MTQPDPSRNDNEQRLFLALILSTLVLLATPYFFSRFSSTPPAEKGTPVTVEPESAEKEVPAERVTPPETAEIESPQETAEDIVGLERTVEIRNDNLVLLFSSRGATLHSIRLLDYLDEPADAVPAFPESLSLVWQWWRWKGAPGEPLELVPQLADEELPRPLAIRTGRADVDEKLADAVYRIEGPVRPKTGDGANEIRFLYQRAGLRVARSVWIPSSGFEVLVKTEVWAAGQRVPLEVSLGAGIGSKPAPNHDFAKPDVAVGAGQSVERYDEGDLKESVTVNDPDWVAVDSQYFCRAMLGSSLEQVRMEAHHPQFAEAEERSTTAALLSASAVVSPGEELRFFFGPKDLEILGRVEPALRELVNYGFFGFLVKPLLYLLKLVYGFVGNYGWAIIILTFLINLVLVPIRYKQIVSMRKMTELQPQMKAIQNRYKGLPRNDPKRQEMNKEVMALYQEHGVNPLGSCLPLLIQMPFLFAFYSMLWGSIELRGAPFILWIQDLSKHDPTLVTPILMGATMVAQQKMTPGGGDPAQRRLMMLMPLVFTFLFLWYSSGLAIYFLFSNVFGMLFQMGVQRLSPELSASAGKAVSNPKRNPRGPKSKNSR